MEKTANRTKQSFRKRFDLAKYLVGLPASPKVLQRQLSANGTFFFSAKDLSCLTDLLREHLSGTVEEVIQEANQICCHRFRLLGYDRLDYGPEIDWHLDAAHGKRAPRKPWFKVPFLSFSIVGDHKVTWELNRHQHLVTLAKAWTLTRDEKFAAEVTRQWYAWRLENSFPLGINWSSSLEVAFRSLSWLWVRALLDNCPAVPTTFAPDLLQDLALNGSYIENYLSTYFSPNTHLLGEAVALFFIGTLCPQIAAAARWQRLGWSIILRAAECQVRPDGVYFEQSLYYHVYALDFFLHSRLLAFRNQIEIPKTFDTTLGKMLNVLQALSQAGPAESFGDDDGGRVFNPRRNRSEHLTDPLAIGAILFGREDLKTSASLTEEALWLYGERAASFFVENSCRPRPKTACFEASGIYVMASSENCRHQMVIDAGPMGAGRAGHGHADALSATVCLDGRRWLIDAGTFCYVANDHERDQFRGTAAHNTLRVDGLDQATPDGPFGWHSLPSVHTERWVHGTTFSLFAGSHNGYSRLPDPVQHRRFVFHLHGAFWLVRDVVEGRKQHRLETSWHFAHDLQVDDVDGSYVAFNPEFSGNNAVRLALVPHQDSGWRWDLGRTEISPAYGMKVPAQVLRASAEVSLPAECAILIAPLLVGSEKLGRLRELTAKETRGSGAVRGYQYDAVGRKHSIMFSAGGENWTVGPWTSDAEFFYCGVRDGEVAQFVVCNGSFVKFDGESLFAHAQKVAYLEWRNDTSGAHISSSDDDAILSVSLSAIQVVAQHD